MTDAICTIAPCEKRITCRGMCEKHYTRWLRHGDPNYVVGRSEATGPAHFAWDHDCRSYRAVHKRLDRLRGRAKEQACADCGQRADHWSYNGGSSTEQTDATGAPFTTDLSCYVPRCSSCHKRLDAPAAADCPRGHPFSGDNLIIRKDGSRVCRACKRVWDRERYLKCRDAGSSDHDGMMSA